MFGAAAEASQYDILKLYNAEGSLVSISPHLEPNTPDNPYRLTIIATSSKLTSSTQVNAQVKLVVAFISVCMGHLVLLCVKLSKCYNIF